MRPLRLELEGFTAFRQRTVIDFKELDLFAITGPTGAGKSSLIDAICYALYGRIPRVNAEMASCISLGLDRLQVTLEFHAGDHDYRVFRETRRKGAPNVRLEYLLPAAEPEPEPEPVGAVAGGSGATALLPRKTEPDWAPFAQGARDVTERIEHIVGLTYDGFTRSVLLPQGQFAEFLAGAPEKRRDVLRSLLRLEVYERMREQSSHLAGQSKAAFTAIETMLRDQYAGATPENLAQRRLDLAAAEAEGARLATLRADLTLITSLAESFEAAKATAVEAAAAATAAAASLETAAALVAAGDAEIAVLEADLDAITIRLAANTYDDRLLAVLAAAANVALALSREEKALAEAEALVKTQAGAGAAAAKAKAKATADHVAALAGFKAAEEALEEARRHDLAAALQSGLHAGDSCPVCGGLVGDLPLLPGDSLAAAQEAFRRTQAAEKAAHATANAAATAVAVAANNATAASTKRDGLRAQVEASRTQLEEALPGFPDHSFPTISGLLNGQRAAREEHDLLDRQHRSADEALRLKQSQLTAARSDLAVLTDRQANLETAAAAASAKATAGHDSLVAALPADRYPELASLLAAERPLSLVAAGQRDRTITAERDAYALAGKLGADVETIAKAIETAAELRTEVEGHKSEHGVADDLSNMLRANRFQAFVQSEALRLLAEDGSEKLRQLSNGRYTLSVTENGQDFEVIDEWNAGDHRSVRTLSGGETFLASLALALALAETLPGLAAGQRMALDSVFLDEGFGSLDQDSLRLAADALDSLRSDGRMVCVITHLPELAERLPARIEVLKSETGSTAAVV